MALKNGAYPFKSAKIGPKIGALPFSWRVIWHNYEKNALKTEHCRSLIKTGSAENQRVDDRKRSISVHFRSKNEDASSVESEHCRFQHLALKRELVMVAKRLKISRKSIKKIIRTWRSGNGDSRLKARNRVQLASLVEEIEQIVTNHTKYLLFCSLNRIFAPKNNWV